jgi:rubrerythrin
MPSGSVAELMDIAMGMEHEAALRYEELSVSMRARDEVDLSALFQELADLEHRHEAGLSDWARRDGLAEPKSQQFAWRLPETFSVEDASGAPLSPYKILGIAVRNEEQAFAFYTYLAAQADGHPDIRLRAEALAREELKHVAQLRRFRRQAYHAAPSQRRGKATAATLSEFYGIAYGLERSSAELAAAAASGLAISTQPGAVLMRQVAEMAQQSADVLEKSVAQNSSRLRTNPPADPAFPTGALETGGMTADEILALCERRAGDVLETYLSIADHAKEDDLLRHAQKLAEMAMTRLALIRASRK